MIILSNFYKLWNKYSDIPNQMNRNNDRAANLIFDISLHYH